MVWFPHLRARASQADPGRHRQRNLRKTDPLPEVHREAERLLLAFDGIAVRATDALHLAVASLAGAAAIVTYDPKLAGAGVRIGMNGLPDVPESRPHSDVNRRDW
jgi:predicted nucleic acid-binding protein